MASALTSDLFMQIQWSCQMFVPDRKVQKFACETDVDPKA